MTVKVASYKRVIIIGIATFSLYLATLFIIVGLTTNWWLEMRSRSIHHDDVEVHFGLHRTCYPASDICTNPRSDYDEKGVLQAIRGLVCTGAFLAMIATGMGMVDLALDRLGITKTVLTIATSITCGLTGLFTIIGCIMYSTNVDIDPELILFPDNLYKSYSFGLTTCAGGMTWISAFLFIWASFLRAEEKFVM